MAAAPTEARYTVTVDLRDPNAKVVRVYHQGRLIDKRTLRNRIGDRIGLGVLLADPSTPTLPVVPGDND